MRIVAWVAALVCGGALGQQQGPVIAVKTGRLLDPATQKVRAGAVVVVQGGRIRSVGDAVPAGAQVVDASGLTVSPGFIDTHTHVMLQGDPTDVEYDEQILKESLPYRALRATRAMRIALEHGFTTLRDIGNEGAGFADVDLKRGGRGGHHRRPAALRGHQGARPDRRLRSRRHHLLLAAGDAQGGPALRRARRLPAGGAGPDRPRRGLDQGLRRPRLLQAARRADPQPAQLHRRRS